jgi:hypothetical protein
LEVYKEEITNLGINYPPWWCKYASAMSFKVLNRPAEASQHFYEAFVSTNSMISKIKIILRDPFVIRNILEAGR